MQRLDLKENAGLACCIDKCTPGLVGWFPPIKGVHTGLECFPVFGAVIARPVDFETFYRFPCAVDHPLSRNAQSYCNGDRKTFFTHLFLFSIA